MTVIRDQFHKAMLNIYDVALKVCNYRATAFRSMVLSMGGVDAAKQLLSSGRMQSGLYELFECGRLDLTVEELVLQEEYRELFEPELLSEAKRRLEMLKD